MAAKQPLDRHARNQPCRTDGCQSTFGSPSKPIGQSQPQECMPLASESDRMVIGRVCRTARSWWPRRPPYGSRDLPRAGIRHSRRLLEPQPRSIVDLLDALADDMIIFIRTFVSDEYKFALRLSCSRCRRLIVSNARRIPRDPDTRDIALQRSRWRLPSSIEGRIYASGFYRKLERYRRALVDRCTGLRPVAFEPATFSCPLVHNDHPPRRQGWPAEHEYHICTDVMTSSVTGHIAIDVHGDSTTGQPVLCALRSWFTSSVAACWWRPAPV
jgi:hypothetical protein